MQIILSCRTYVRYFLNSRKIIETINQETAALNFKVHEGGRRCPLNNDVSEHWRAASEYKWAVASRERSQELLFFFLGSAAAEELFPLDFLP